MADRDLRIRLLFETLDRVSKPLKEISGNSTKAARELKETRDKLAELKNTSRDIDAFRALKIGLKEAGSELSDACARVTALGREMAQVEKPTRAMQTAFGRAKREAATLETQYQQNGRRLTELRGKLTAAGVATTGLARHERELRREIGSTNQQISEQGRRMQALNERTKRIAGARGALSAGQDGAARSFGAGVAGVTATIGIAAPIKAVSDDAMKFEDIMADVRKVVDFERPKQFQQMSDDIIALSTKLPMTAEGIGKIVAAGGRSGIARKELLGFATDAAKMGIAFDMEADQAGDMMATWRTAFAIGREGTLQLADQVNALTNAYGGKVDAVTEMITRIGPLGRVAGVASPQLAAMAQLMSKVGLESEVGATGIKNMLLTLTKGEAATKGQNKAFESLGLDAVVMSKRMQKDAGGAIIDVLSRIQKLDKAAQAGTLTELFGSESVAAIAPMLTSLDALRTNFDLVGDASKYAGSMQKEYDARAATSSNAVKLAENNYTALKITIGTMLLPTITELAQSMGRGLQSLRAFAQAHPELIMMLVKVGAAFAGLMLAFAAFNFLRGGILATIAPLRFVMKLMGLSPGAAFGKAVAQLGGLLMKVGPIIARVGGVIVRAAMFMAQGLLRAGMFLLANPMVLGILALVAVLAVAGYMIYKHWDTIKAAFFQALGALGGIWESIKAAFSGGIGGIAATLLNFSPVGLLYRAFAALMNWLGISMPARLSDLGKNLIQGLINGITGMLGALKNTIVGAAGSAAKWFKEKMGIHSPSRVFMAFGGHLMGGLGAGIERDADLPIRRLAATARGLMGALPERLVMPAIVPGNGTPAPIAARAAVPASDRMAVPDAGIRRDTVLARSLSETVRDLLRATPLPQSVPGILAGVGTRIAAALAATTMAPSMATLASQSSTPQAARPAGTPGTAAGSGFNFNIYQQPGQSAQDLARMIADAVKKAAPPPPVTRTASFGDRQDWED